MPTGAGGGQHIPTLKEIELPPAVSEEIWDQANFEQSTDEITQILCTSKHSLFMTCSGQLFAAGGYNSEKNKRISNITEALNDAEEKEYVQIKGKKNKKGKKHQDEEDSHEEEQFGGKKGKKGK